MKILFVLFLLILAKQEQLPINAKLNETLAARSNKVYELDVPPSNKSTYIRFTTPVSTSITSASISLMG